MKYIKYIILLIILIWICINALCNRAQPIALPRADTKSDLVLVPLDSRPVCSTMVQKLGNLVGINVIVPPKELLDNYQESADSKKLWQWLQTIAPSHNSCIISADILLHGSLLQTRQHLASASEQAEFFAQLAQLQQGLAAEAAPALASANTKDSQQDGHFRKVRQAGQLSLFSVIPRLLVSDEVYPDCWYQFHLMRYSQLLDMVRINGDFAMTRELLAYTEEIPADILRKYTQIFAQSQAFNAKLLSALEVLSTASSPVSVIIGQDDSSPFGLPKITALQLEQQIQRQGLAGAHNQALQAQLTYGADEIAALLLARSYLQQQHWQPKLYVHYGSSKTEFKHMPYMATSVGATLRNQAQLLQATLVNTPEQADLLLFVHCGDDDAKPSVAEAQKLASLLQQGKQVALIDLSANFEAEEMLLPLLLEQKVPLNRLIAYAGWNTFSNSSGTALAQACLFLGRLQELQADHNTDAIPALYAANLNFTAERMLEDFYYQKLIHPQLRPYLESFGITPTALEPEEKREVEHYIHQRLSFYAAKLLWQNLGRTPFYTSQSGDYYLAELTVGAQLPWSRIFEVDLNVHSSVGHQALAP